MHEIGSENLLGHYSLDQLTGNRHLVYTQENAAIPNADTKTYFLLFLPTKREYAQSMQCLDEHN